MTITTEVQEGFIKEKSIDYGSLTNAITGNEKDYLYNRLKQGFKNAVSIDIIVSFLMESGVKLIANDLKEAIERGVKVRILSGNYLNITQPSALYYLKDKLQDKVDLRFYNNPRKSFHPKAYIFHYENSGDIFVGSSNISRGALTNSIEWNYRLRKENNEEDFNVFYNTFEDLFNNHSFEVTDEILREYAKSWVRPKLYKDIEKDQQEEEIKVIEFWEPKGAQIEALHALNKTREEGFDKALVVAATGIGKTYLSAFDSKDFNKILFVAHREEIIKQAEKSFNNVRPNSKSGLFYGNSKDYENKDLLFALVQTLGKEEYLNEEYFKRDYFDYIVVDEFHHAVSGNYKKILNYFKPKFLLGLTATPERLDNKDVFSLCDYNTVYEIRLKEAINRGDLVPFKYYGIYDESVNYDEIDFKNGKYDNKKLEEALMINRRGNLVLRHYLKYNSKIAMGFCSSKNHAEYMAKYFNDNKVKALAVYSGEMGENSANREEALNLLKTGQVQVLFSVDMFNEGLDVPSIDLVMFLRPTESPTIFLQQLGRGLRKYKGKEYLNVLDFIGNYKKANLIPFLLSGKSYDKTLIKKGNVSSYEYPEDCHVDFDLNIIDIFKEQAEIEMTVRDKLKEEFLRVEEEIGHVPSRVELFDLMDNDIYDNIKSKSNINPFIDYMNFLNDMDRVNEEETALMNTRAYDFINMIETTSMSKTYKMPVLLAMYNEGYFKTSIDDDDLYHSFRDFYNYKSNGVDMRKDKSTKDFEIWDKKNYVSLAKKNPIKFLLKSSSTFFYENEEGNFTLSNDIHKYVNNKTFLKHVKDAIDFRVKQYYRTRFEKGKGDF
ncbi:DEAD/DEAH box helicase family protein [Clostridium frigidicarnis]|uniref:Helicase conserved C-terminal domain-containing protein n=1 Tax=Clostridium frigidicarnis TaxID=84698 RepID=A0A1I0YDT8_9CLOT|nr:DEAD/DEAH box helicase family protein [Clostridium frigidicarnis]SFB11322.1 Helicase conserved C-terminal domain-containing protein [Clostridium frigidicarnis]